MTDNTNKGFWERMARIYTAFIIKKFNLKKKNKKTTEKNGRFAINNNY